MSFSSLNAYCCSSNFSARFTASFVVQQKGLVSYINRYEYKNAKTEDLWSVLSEVSGEPVKELMDSWTKQKGYPVVSVQLRSEALVIEQVIFDEAIFSVASKRSFILIFLGGAVFLLWPSAYPSPVPVSFFRCFKALEDT